MTDTNRIYWQARLALTFAKASLLVAIIGGGWIAGRADVQLVAAAGLVIAIVCAVAVYRLADIRVGR